MNEHKEKLSTLLDDFRNTEQDQVVLNDALKDVNQRYTLSRYQLISDVMRNEVGKSIDMDLSQRVMSQIEKEPVLQGQKTAVQVKTQPQASRLWSFLFKPMAGVAVAATVAFVAVNSLSPALSPQDSSAQLATNSSSQKVEKLVSLPVISNAVRVSGNATALTTPAGMNWKIKRNEPAIQKKLNAYLINHNENSNSMHGIIPQARVVGFDAQK